MTACRDLGLFQWTDGRINCLLAYRGWLNDCCSFQLCSILVIAGFTLQLLDCVLMFEGVVQAREPTSTSMISEFRSSSRSTDKKIFLQFVRARCLVSVLCGFSKSCMATSIEETQGESSLSRDSSTASTQPRPHKKRKGFRKLKRGSRSHCVFQNFANVNTKIFWGL